MEKNETKMNQELKTVPKNDETMSIRLTESDYLKMKLEYYIESNMRYDEEFVELPNHASRLNTLLLDYILRNFTLDEIYIIFIENQIYWVFQEDDITLSKETAIENINCLTSCPPEGKKILKNKVWNTPIVMFGLVQALIRKSKLFVNAETGITEYPDLTYHSFKFAFIPEPYE